MKEKITLGNTRSYFIPKLVVNMNIMHIN